MADTGAVAVLDKLRSWWDRVKGWVGFVAGLLFSLALTVAARRERDRTDEEAVPHPQSGGRSGDGRRPRRPGF